MQHTLFCAACLFLLFLLFPLLSCTTVQHTTTPTLAQPIPFFPCIDHPALLLYPVMPPPDSFAQTTMDLPLDDNTLTGSKIYTTTHESLDDKRMDSTYATPCAHSISPLYPIYPTLHLHIPSSFQESSGFLMLVQLINDVNVVFSPEENFSMAQPHPGQSTPGTGLLAHDSDNNMHKQVQFSHSFSLYPPLIIS